MHDGSGSPSVWCFRPGDRQINKLDRKVDKRITCLREGLRERSFVYKNNITASVAVRFGFWKHSPVLV